MPPELRYASDAPLPRLRLKVDSRGCLKPSTAGHLPPLRRSKRSQGQYAEKMLARFRTSLKWISRPPAVRQIPAWCWMTAAIVITVCLWTLAGENKSGGYLDASTAPIADWSTEVEPVSGESKQASQVPHFEDLSQLGAMKTDLLPGGTQTGQEGQERRLIFIGDIHGCYQELMTLLDKVEYNEETDHIVTVGDMINKGPQSQAVIDFLIDKGASCVRGNHDDRILHKVAPNDGSSTHGELPEDRELTLARSLTIRQIEYLQSCPLVLKIGQVPFHGDIVVVHGGLVPSLELGDQDPWAVMNMRVIHPETHIPKKEHDLEDHIPWADLWNQEQLRHSNSQIGTSGAKTMLDSHHGVTVIYGHDAERGLKIGKYTKGLDSACYKGRKLTALVLGNKPEEGIIQVECKKYS